MCSTSVFYLNKNATQMTAMMKYGKSCFYFSSIITFKKGEGRMKKFVQPEVDVIKFSVEDVITASSGEDLPNLDGLLAGNCT